MSFFSSSKIAARTRFDNVNESEFEKIFQFPPRLLPSAVLCAILYCAVLMNCWEISSKRQLASILFPWLPFVPLRASFACFYVFMASQWFKVFVSSVIDCVSQDFYFHQQSAASSAAGAFDLNLIQRLFDFQHIHTIDCTTQLYLSVSLFQPMDIYLGTKEEDFFMVRKQERRTQGKSNWNSSHAICDSFSVYRMNSISRFIVIMFVCDGRMKTEKRS